MYIRHLLFINSPILISVWDIFFSTAKHLTDNEEIIFHGIVVWLKICSDVVVLFTDFHIKVSFLTGFASPIP